MANVADFTLTGKVIAQGPAGANFTEVTVELTDPNGASRGVFGLRLPNAVAQDLAGSPSAGTVTLTQGDVVAVTLVSTPPLDAHTYTGNVLGQVVAQYRGTNLTALTAKLYTRVIATGKSSDAAVTGGTAHPAADGTFTLSAASNALVAGTQFVIYLFDGSNQLGTELPIAAS